MNEMPLVSVVILSWNRREDLRLSLTQVFQLDYSPYEVIVVDNNSTDGSCEMVRNGFPDVHLIQLEKNIGIAGWNEGFKVAKGEYILVLDDDSYPEVDAPIKAVQILEHDRSCGIVAYKIYNQQWERYESEKFPQYNLMTFIGCGAMIRKSIFKTAGMFEQTLFLYEHEIEFSMRVRNCGFDIQLHPDAIVYHRMSSTGRPRKHIGDIDRRRQFFVLRNILLILLMHFPLFRVLGRILRIIIGRTIFGIKNKCLTVFIRAVISSIIKLPHVISHRLIITPHLQRDYEFGGFAGGFFFEVWEVGLRRPKWL